jgi:hypothetical protein
MKEIILKQETIDAIIEAIKEDLSVEDEITTVDDAEFEQDGNTIFVGYKVFAEWKKEMMYHSEVPYNNYEDLSKWEVTGSEVENIAAYDEDGEELAISEEYIKIINKKLAA